MLRRRIVYARWLALSLLLLVAVLPARAGSGQRLIVAPGGPYLSIAAALAAAAPGDIVEVRGGIHPAPLEITVPGVTLQGVDNPVIDGGGQGSLVIIAAPDVSLQGFTLRNTGRTLSHEDTAIVAQAPRVTIADNTLENVLFGIYFANANNGVARNNVVRGLALEPSLRGDGIRVWYSNHVTLESNTVTNSRDTLIWYAQDIFITGNTFSGNRYGLHFMYSSHARVEDNTFTHNSVGSYLMYSDGLILRHNTIAYSRGPSGYGVALKDMDDVEMTDNLVIGNRTGLYLDNSPFSVDRYNTFTGNVFAFNDLGVSALPAVARNIFQNNSFLENLQQTGVHGRGTLQGNIWHQDGQGNYWSDYSGYDAEGDGIGDRPYRAEKLFESLADAYPVLRLFTFSPAAGAIDFAASAFPSLRPEPRLIDEAPLIRYNLPASLRDDSDTANLPFLLGAGLLAAIGIGAVALGFAPGRPAPVRAAMTPVSTERLSAVSTTKDTPMITVHDLSKYYGAVAALEDVTFSISAGEAVALWGANGAGKTTALRCLMGVIPFTGQVTVNGLDPQRQGRAVRSAIGYVPQEAAFYDLTAREVLAFYARLKKAPAARIATVLEQVDLADHADKTVSALSGGMKRRLALAAALLADPPILLLDEPTANLDAQSRQSFLQLVRELNRAGKTIVFSSHRLEEVATLAERAIVLERGRLIRDCRPDELAGLPGAARWLRVYLPPDRHEQAARLLGTQGFAVAPNGQALYVGVGAGSRMQPLRLLEAAQIPVEDFDLVDGEGLTLPEDFV
ncbi:MAG: nitrous oxide reductase family maturation protein NosD [Anaerolineae bacterium]|nr:nitrous oxide reductase family maturation protein NosD [Anaerolineae bacterium]